MKKKIFITGASSFIGNTLTEKLKNKYNVSVLIHKKGIDVQNNDIKIVSGGIENVSEWENNLSGVDIVIHLAAISHTKNVTNYDSINNLGTKKIIDAAKRNNVKQFIYISTRSIGVLCGEYGSSKEQAEIYLKKSGINYTILRVGEVYDTEFSRKEGLGAVIYLMRKIPIIPYPFGLRSTLAPIHRDDVHDVVMATIDNSVAYNKTYVVAGPEDLSLREIMAKIKKYYKLNTIFIPIPIIFLRLVFFIFFKKLKFGSPDQFDRLICKKNPLSQNVLDDLHIKPRSFLSTL